MPGPRPYAGAKTLCRPRCPAKTHRWPLAAFTFAPLLLFPDFRTYGENPEVQREVGAAEIQGRHVSNPRVAPTLPTHSIRERWEDEVFERW
jgi:hypothetical protein